MATITRKSIRQGDDFKILITFKDRNGVALEATEQQFKFIYHDVYENQYEVSYDGKERTNCYIENGNLFGVFEDYKLACCVLKREAWYWVADDAFTDGRWDHGNTVRSGIELTHDGGTREVEEEAEVPGGFCVNEALAISKGEKGESAYEAAQKGGYTGTIDEFYQSLATTTDLSQYDTKSEAENKFIRKQAGKGLSTNDYTNEDKALLHSVSGNVLQDTESVSGKLTILGKEYTLYKKMITISDLPKSAGEEKEFVIDAEPLGGNIYLSICNIVVKDGNNGYYPEQYKIKLLHVSDNYQTLLKVSSSSTISENLVLSAVIEYVKFDLEKVELKVKNIAAEVDKNSIAVSMPLLKYDKQFAYTLIFDDDTVRSNKAFFTIHKKWIDNEQFQHFGQVKTTGSTPTRTLGYTDGLGLEKRFTYGLAVLPGIGNDYIPDYMNPADGGQNKNYPYMAWSEIVKIMDFGNDIHFHDVNAQNGILEGIKACQTVAEEFLKEGIKVLVRPNGNDKYIEAARLYDDIVMMTTEGMDGNKYVLTDSTNLAKGLIYRRNCDALTSDVIVSKLTELKDTHGAWWCDFSHGASTDILTSLNAINDTFGKGGSDSIWFTTIDEIFEYWFIRKYTKIRKDVDSNGDLIITLLLPKIQHGRHNDFTLQLSDLSYSNQLVEPISNNVYGLSAGAIKDMFSINVIPNKKIVDLADKYTSLYESTSDNSYKDDAMYFIDQLRVELQQPFLDRLNVGEIAPVLNSILLNSGVSTTYDRNITVAMDIAGSITHYRVAENGIEEAAWIACTSKSFSTLLSEGLGIKAISVQVKNSHGISVVKSASITLQEQPTITFTVTAHSNNVALGTVTPATQTVASGGNASVTAQANSGYIIESWVGATTSTGTGTASGIGSITNVLTDKSITCNFKPKSSEPSVTRCILSSGYSYADAVFDAETGITKTMSAGTFKDFKTTDGVNFGKVKTENVNNCTAIVANMDKLTDKRGAITGNNSGIYPDKYLANMTSPITCSVGLPTKRTTLEVPNGTYNIKLFCSTIKAIDVSEAPRYSVNGEVKVCDFVLNNLSEYLTFDNVVVANKTIVIDAVSAGQNKLAPINLMVIEQV